MQDDAIVYVVDDDTDLRDAYVALFRSVDVRVESCATAREFLDRYDPARPSCVVLDLRLPGMSGLDLQALLNRRRLPPPIVFVSGHGDVAVAVQAVRDGALDFLEKPVRHQELLDRVFEGLSRDVEIRRRFAELLELERRAGQLTPREREVMALVVGGASNRGIAAELGVTPKAIEAYRARVMRKMEASSLAALVRMNVALELWGDATYSSDVARRRRAAWSTDDAREDATGDTCDVGDRSHAPASSRDVHVNFSSLGPGSKGRGDPLAGALADSHTTH